jgi:hypothetical protein
MRTASIVMAIALMLQAVHISETSFYSNETTQLCIPEGCYFHAVLIVNLDNETHFV